MSDIEHPRITEVGRLLADKDRAYLDGYEAGFARAQGEAQDEINRLREALTEIRRRAPCETCGAWGIAAKALAKEAGG
jgi:hypothetical protein